MKACKKIRLEILNRTDHSDDVGIYGGDNIKADFREISLVCMDWIYLARNRYWWRVITLMNVLFPCKVNLTI